MSGRVRSKRFHLALAGTGLAALCLFAGTAPGTAPAQTASGPSYSGVVSVPEAVDRTCYETNLGATAGANSIAVTPTLEGASFAVVDARLEGPAGGDWDLAVFDQAGKVVAASAEPDASEVASGYVLDPGSLTVQACRISGAGSVAELTVDTTPVRHDEVERASLAFVQTPSRTDEQTLQSLGLDLTEHGGEDYVAVVLHGADDRLALEKAGLQYEVQIPNLARQSGRERAADERYASRVRRSSLPSGSDTYRRLFQYEQEMKDLVEQNPDIVRPITLNHETWEGRTVQGIEISTDVDNRRDGKPVFLMMGVHHAREWPSGEHTIEWAYQLINGYKNGNERVLHIVRNVRTIIVPIVNPDGFNASREAGEQQGASNGRDGDDTVNFAAAGPNEYRRKNCRLADDSEAGDCAQPAFGLASFGVDPNRNYGAFWGGPGSGDSPEAEDYHGPAPFSEPETKNIRELISERQVTMLITNHTFSDLVLRPPGLASEPDPVDEVALKALGDAMAAENGYLSQQGFQLYDTTGTTEDWSYNSTGGFGYTFEIGCNDTDDPDDPTDGLYDCTGNFHPTYPNVVAEWEGTSPQASAINGRGNREAYFIAEESAADTAKHSLLAGDAPPGAVLKLEKTFETPTSQDSFFTDHLETELKVPDSGSYAWHINPSTRPLVAQDRGRIPLGPPSPDIDLCTAGHGDGCAPGPSAHPCGDATTTDAECFNEHPFEITNGPTEDNDAATVALEWITPTSDWDLFVYRDGNGDGDSQDPEDTQVGTSAQGPTSGESTTFVRPQEGLGDTRLLPGKYVARVVNFAAAEPYEATVHFEGPEPPTKAKTETWSFSCAYAGETRVSQEILIGRGERQDLDLSACGLPDGGGGGGGGAATRCKGKEATLVGSKGDDKMRGTPKRDVMVGLGGNDKIVGAGGNDVICAKGGDDRVKGGGGKDIVRGGGGADRASGGGGDDGLRGGRNADRLSGGGGDDTLGGGSGHDRVNGGPGKDKCGGGRRDRIRNC